MNGKSGLVGYRAEKALPLAKGIIAEIKRIQGQRKVGKTTQFTDKFLTDKWFRVWNFGLQYLWTDVSTIDRTTIDGMVSKHKTGPMSGLYCDILEYSNVYNGELYTLANVRDLCLLALSSGGDGYVWLSPDQASVLRLDPDASGEYYWKDIE